MLGPVPGLGGGALLEEEPDLEEDEPDLEEDEPDLEEDEPDLEEDEPDLIEDDEPKASVPDEDELFSVPELLMPSELDAPCSEDEESSAVLSCSLLLDSASGELDSA